MSRIAKSDVNAALDRAAKNILDAAGLDGVTSRKDMKKALSGMSGTEKALTDRFFRFVDHRDAKPDARITKSDVERAVVYSREHLIAKYDLSPQNGLSSKEIAQMSITGQLAVKLAAELKGITIAPPAHASDLGKAVTEAAKDANYMSESDSTPAYVEAKLNGRDISGDVVMELFATELKKSFEAATLKDFTFEKLSPKSTKEFFPGMAEVSDPNDADEVKNAAAWKALGKVLGDNLTDMQIFRIGPRDEDHPNELATDQGAYEYYAVGKTADGKLAGVTFESVET